ncbi:hypothetical protein TDB9533_04226 [Thalassocella blandensis]|nr:hypothetical protein TDB9533_04226 [Thalassocella blandensis]
MRALIWVAVLFSTVSCAWLRGQNHGLPIVKHANGMREIYVVQTVEVVQNGTSQSSAKNSVDSLPQTQQFMTLTTIKDGQFLIVGVSALGQRLFSLQSVAGEVKVEKSDMLPDDVPLLQLLGFIQFVFWPEALQAAQYVEPWHLRKESGVRQLLYSKTAMVQANFSSESPQWNDTIALTYPNAGLTITIKPIEVKFL